jgi:hypothetical protein
MSLADPKGTDFLECFLEARNNLPDYTPKLLKKLEREFKKKFLGSFQELTAAQFQDDFHDFIMAFERKHFTSCNRCFHRSPK